MEEKSLYTLQESQTYHAVHASKDDKDAVKLIKARSDKKFDLILHRYNQLVRVTDDTPSFATIPYICEIVRANHAEALINGNFNFITVNSKGDYVLLRFNGWLITETKTLDFIYDISVSEWTFYPNDLSLLKIVSSSSSEVRDLSVYEQLLSIKMEHSEVDMREFYLSNIVVKILKKRQLIGGVAVIAAVLCVAGFAYKILTVPEDKVIKKTEYVTVDDYIDYKDYVSEYTQIQNVATPLAASWLFLKSLPEGWKFNFVKFDSASGKIQSEIRHIDGKISDLELLKRLNPNGQWMNIDGQKVTYAAPLGGAMIDDGKSIPSFSRVRTVLMDRAVAYGGQLKSNKIIEHKMFQTQLFNITFRRVNPSYLLIIEDVFKDLPLVIKSLEINNSELSVDTDISLVIEIFGETNERG